LDNYIKTYFKRGIVETLTICLEIDLSKELPTKPFSNGKLLDVLKF